MAQNKYKKNDVARNRKYTPNSYSSSSQLIQPASDGEVKRLETEFDKYKEQNSQSIRDMNNKIDNMKKEIDQRWSQISKGLWIVSLLIVILFVVLVVINSDAQKVISHICH